MKNIQTYLDESLKDSIKKISKNVFDFFKYAFKKPIKAAIFIQDSGAMTYLKEELKSALDSALDNGKGTADLFAVSGEKLHPINSIDDIECAGPHFSMKLLMQNIRQKFREYDLHIVICDGVFDEDADTIDSIDTTATRVNKLMFYFINGGGNLYKKFEQLKMFKKNEFEYYVDK